MKIISLQVALPSQCFLGQFPSPSNSLACLSPLPLSSGHTGPAVPKLSQQTQWGPFKPAALKHLSPKWHGLLPHVLKSCSNVTSGRSSPLTVFKTENFCTNTLPPWYVLPLTSLMFFILPRNVGLMKSDFCLFYSLMDAFPVPGT